MSFALTVRAGFFDQGLSVGAGPFRRGNPRKSAPETDNRLIRIHNT
jgi:hypothetical protein